MFGLVAARPVPARELLRDAPRSLRTLSNEHPDGWGVALRTATAADVDWMVHRSTECAARCTRYDELVDQVATRLLIAHVRQKTVGEAKLANTHPFRRGRFVFAHNGTVRAVAALVARCSPARLAEITGDTDSERLFAFLLTRIDEAGGDVARGVVRAVGELHALPPDELGSATFLMSCGERLYAHRFGRSLFTLVRHGAAESRRTAAAIVASERLTDEAWLEVPERALVAIDIDLARDAVVQPLAA
jgi:glutamine amidotransferase